MKNIVIGFVAVLTTGIAFSQNKSSFDIETQGGYEYNYFKSPKEIRSDGVLLTEEDLISSSVYQDIDVAYRFRAKWNKKNRFRILLNPFSRIFYENVDDSYWSVNAVAKYDHKFSKKFSFLSELRFKRMNREGLGGDQDVLINPLGYTNYGATVGVQFAPFENNETTVEGFYNLKDFDAFGIRDLQYDEFGAQISSIQSFDVNNLEHKLGVNGYVKKRLYDTFNASEIVTDGERDWDYAKGTLFYELPFSSTFKIRPNFAYYVRIDNSTDRSGFNQFGPGASIAFKNKMTKIRSTVSFITRNYKQIEARNTDEAIGEKLTYEYANFHLNASHSIGNGFSLTAIVHSRIRSTNYTDIDARSFRNYRNQYAGFGVLWEF